MGPARKRNLYVLVSLLFLVIPAGCGTLANLIDDNGSNPTASPTAQTAVAHQPGTKLPPDVPADIPILEGAKGLTAVKTGDGVTKGGGFYQLSYLIAAKMEDTALRYRKILADHKYDYEDEPVADSVSLTGSTPSWIFYLTIAKSSKVAGETSVTISYSK
jgi:hypothetical protein